jgi:hypothetical protein
MLAGTATYAVALACDGADGSLPRGFLPFVYVFFGSAVIGKLVGLVIASFRLKSAVREIEAKYGQI